MLYILLKFINSYFSSNIISLKNKPKSFSVLIPDAGSPYFLGVLYGLSQIRGITIYAISNKRHCPIKYSRFIKHYYYFQDKGDYKKWVLNINNIVKKYNIDLIMPVDEFAIRQVIKYKPLFYKKERLCVLPTLTNFDIANDKSKLSRHMQNNRINCSKSITIEAGGVLNNISLNFPVVAKPVEGFGGGKGIYKFDAMQECKMFFSKNKFDYGYLIEEYITGYDVGCNVLCDKGVLLAHTIQKGNLFEQAPFSPQIGLDFLNEPKLYEEVAKLIQSLNWSGIANIDLRYDEEEKVFKVLEVNPRYWYTLDASLAAGVNFPYLYCLHSLGVNLEKPEYKFISYLNLKGLKKRLKSNFLFVFNLKFIFNNTILRFAIRDPMVISYRIYNRIRSDFFKIVNKT